MSAQEVQFKTQMWEKVNADYLKEQSIKEERDRKEREEAEKEGREVKGKKRKNSSEIKSKGLNRGPNQTAIEAIEKIVQEKKISTKINYDVLRSLSFPLLTKSGIDESEENQVQLNSRKKQINLTWIIHM
jgi:transcription factor IIIB subunit 2